MKTPELTRPDSAEGLTSLIDVITILKATRARYQELKAEKDINVVAHTKDNPDLDAIDKTSNRIRDELAQLFITLEKAVSPFLPTLPEDVSIFIRDKLEYWSRTITDAIEEDNTFKLFNVITSSGYNKVGSNNDLEFTIRALEGQIVTPHPKSSP